jgi:hypothetical protein
MNMRVTIGRISSTVVLAAALLALGGCGVLLEADFPGCATTGSPKTYRGIGCTRKCKAEYTHCTNNKNADPDNDCQCTRDPISLPQEPVPEALASSCACYFPGNPSYVNLHLVNCPAWLPRIPNGASKIAVGRPIGSGEDSSCTNVCGSGSEIRGIFQVKTSGAGFCRPEAAIFPGTIRADFVSGGQLASTEPELREFYARLPKGALARVEYRTAQRDSKLAALPGGVRTVQLDAGKAAAPVFNMRELNVDCRAECANGGQYCVEFQVDADNARSIRESLSALPAAATRRSIPLSGLRQLFGNVTTACSHPSVEFDAAGRMRATGSACTQPLYFSMPGVKQFTASVSVPGTVTAEYTAAGGNRQMVFSNPDAMLALNVQPAALQRLYGGKVRMASFSSERVVFESQNYCIAIKLP